MHRLQAKVKSEEWYAVILSFIYYFCVLGAYYVIRPVRDQLAAEGGSARLMGFFVVTFVATLFLTPLFSWVVSRWRRAVVMPMIYLFFIVCQLLFMILLRDPNLLSQKALSGLFFVWVSIFNLFAVSVFWSFMTDIWDDSQARRLFPIIALGGAAGAVVGPLITHALVAIIGSGLLLSVSVALLMVATLCVLLLGNWAHKYGVHRFEAGSEAALGGSMFDGLMQIFSNQFIAITGLIMLLNDAIGTVAYVLVTDYSGMSFPHNAIAQTRFAANIDFTTNLMQILIQLTVTRWLLARYGAGVVFAACATIIVTACLLMTFVKDPYAPLIGTLPFVALILILTRSLSYGMIQPARETLYTLVPRDLRYKGKNAVDTVVWRGGDVLSLFAVNGVKALGVTVAGFGIIWAFLAGTSGFLGWRLANRVERGDFEQST